MCMEPVNLVSLTFFLVQRLVQTMESGHSHAGYTPSIKGENHYFLLTRGAELRDIITRRCSCSEHEP